MCYNYGLLSLFSDLDSQISIQEKLLEQQNHTLKPDVEFLESFAGVVGSRWPSVAASLSLSDEEMEEVRKEESSPQNQALQMLNMWCARENATFHSLCRVLQTFLLFQ